MQTLIKYSGISLILGGFFFAIPNTIILPFVDFTTPFAELLISTLFFYRMIIAGLTVAFLLFGSIGIYLHHEQPERFKKLLNLTFIIAFFGTAFMLANEWHQIFVLPEVAILNPDAVNKLGNSNIVNSYSIGAMISMSMFSFGWISYCIIMLMFKKLKKIGPSLVIAGFLVIPLFSGLFSPIIGGVVGGIILGLGFMLIGSQIVKSIYT